MVAEGTLMLPNEIPVSGVNQYNKLSIEDTGGLLGEYIANFIISSVTPDS